MTSKKASARKILKEIESSEHDFRIVIFQNEGGTFSYSKSWFDAKLKEFGELGPSCGIYDSEEVAEREARLRNSWPDD